MELESGMEPGTAAPKQNLRRACSANRLHDVVEPANSRSVRETHSESARFGRLLVGGLANHLENCRDEGRRTSAASPIKWTAHPDADCDHKTLQSTWYET